MNADAPRNLRAWLALTIKYLAQRNKRRQAA